MKYIVEHGIPGSVPGCNTIEELRCYLESDPHKGSRLASCDNHSGSYVFIWEVEGKCERDRKILIDTLRDTWIKHFNDDAEIGWNEICNKIDATLSEVVGEEEHGEWVSKVSPEKTI